MVRRTKQNETEVRKSEEKSPSYERRAVYPDLGHAAKATGPEPQPEPQPEPYSEPYPEAGCDAIPPRPWRTVEATRDFTRPLPRPLDPGGPNWGETQAPYLAESEASRVLRLESTARGTIYNPVYPFEAQIEYFYRFSAKKGTQKQVLAALIQRLVDDLARL